MAIRNGKRNKQKGPGKEHRKGISIKQLFKLFPDNATAEKWFQEQVWQGTPRCPRCGSTNINLKAKHKHMPHHCRDCRRYFSIKTGTVMESSKVSYQDWAIAMYLQNTNLKGISSMRLHRELNVTQRTAWFILHRLRETENNDPVKFDGTCEVDETYIGGKVDRMNKQQRASWKKKHGTGKGGKGKIIVGCIRERETGRIQMAILPDSKADTLQGFVVRRTTENAEIQTDEHPGYKGISDTGRKHETITHSLDQFVRRDGLHYITTNAVESTFGTLKANILGVYHHVSVKHIDRYLNELTGKRNTRDLDAIEQVAHNARNMVGKRIRYADLTERTPEQEEAYMARNYEEFGLLQACIEAAGFPTEREYRDI